MVFLVVGSLVEMVACVVKGFIDVDVAVGDDLVFADDVNAADVLADGEGIIEGEIGFAGRMRGEFLEYVLSFA